jgi:hypothetical protein
MAMAENPVNGNVFCTVAGGGTNLIYYQAGGSGNFVSWSVNSTAGNWYAIACKADGEMYAAIGSGGMYFYSLDTSSYHRNYQSLISGNYNRNPADNPQAWLDIGATNRMKPFDGKTGSQASKATPMVYHVEVGAAFDSVAILNCANTSVRIQTDSPSYDTTVSTGATDIVKTNLAGTASTHLTVTVNKTAGTALLGELVIGNKHELGMMLYNPEVGITDYSVKEVDEWGNWIITERAYSKRLTCIIEIANTSLDSVFNLLASCRATPVVWQMSINYSCLVVYGYFRDFSLVIGSRTYSNWNLQIEGLT